MRITPELHKDLAEYAEANNESLNSAVTTLIERLVFEFS
ncbi:toxin-antitoxin system HicB family antitoxin [Lactobacillus gallinarum]